MAGAEIVQGESDAQPDCLFHDRNDFFQIFKGCRFNDLKVDGFWRNIGKGFKADFEIVYKMAGFQMARRNIDADPEIKPQASPLTNLGKGRLHDEIADGNGKVGFLHQVYEGGRKENPLLRMLPANERFHAGHHPPGNIDLRLVVQEKLPPVETFHDPFDHRIDGCFFIDLRKACDIPADFTFMVSHGADRDALEVALAAFFPVPDLAVPEPYFMD